MHYMTFGVVFAENLCFWGVSRSIWNFGVVQRPDPRSEAIFGLFKDHPPGLKRSLPVFGQGGGEVRGFQVSKYVREMLIVNYGHLEGPTAPSRGEIDPRYPYVFLFPLLYTTNMWYSIPLNLQPRQRYSGVKLEKKIGYGTRELNSQVRAKT